MSRYSGWEKTVVDAALKSKAKNKYGAVRVTVDGIYFDSKAEAARYSELKLMQHAGLIFGLSCHPSYSIDINDRKICVVELDFLYWTKARTQIIEDVKGRDNPLSALKRKLVEACHGIKIDVIR